MGIGASVFLLVLGAILTFAVHLPVDGVNVHALGIILMVIGGIGIVLSAFFWESWGYGGWGGPTRRVYRRERTYVDPAVPVAAARVAPVAPVVPVAPGVPVAGVPMAGQAVPVAGVPMAGQAVPVVPARVVRRPVRVRQTTVYEDDL